MRPRRRSENTGEDSIRDEQREGYVVDPHGKIRGEVRNYDPYSRFGEIMLYDIDIFGFVSGYVSRNWDVMSEEDLLADSKLAGKLYEARYQVWKRQNVIHLKHEYMKKYGFYDKREFDRLCRDLFRKI
ncbi:MAG: hypothetical protein KGI27_01625 [Thaumarchaeota archaeon]|nr:hypothetical protein [Nitrososphaerota archaeon]